VPEGAYPTYRKHRGVDLGKPRGDLVKELGVEFGVAGNVECHPVSLQDVADLGHVVSGGDGGDDRATDLRAIPVVELDDVLVPHCANGRAEATRHDDAQGLVWIIP